MPEDQENQYIKQTQESQEAAAHDAPFVQPRWLNWMGIYYLVMVIILALLVFALWPVSAGPGNQSWEQGVSLFGVNLFSPLPDEIRLLLLVGVVGALGSYVHGATSFVSYVGNRRLVASWMWWYLLKPFKGMTLALILYFVIRGGLLSSGTPSTDVSVYGVAAVAGLAGMFSKQATDKLHELFNNLFRTKEGSGDDTRIDKLEDKPAAGKPGNAVQEPGQ